MLEHHTLSLEIPPKQARQLQTSFQSLVQDIERLGLLKPASLQELRQNMETVLVKQAGWAALAAANDGVHRVLQVKHENNDLLNLPWRLAVGDQPFLYLTKCHTQYHRPETFVPDNPLPLKVLVMIASPDDSDLEHRLPYEEEEARILESFRPLYEHGLAQVDFTDDGSLESLVERLRANHYHILHFSGHGLFKNGEGFLELEDQLTLYRKRVSGADFAQALNQKPEHQPALVVLSSCQTAQGTAAGDDFSGITNHLLRVGIPAVVSMGWSVMDRYATLFAAELYRQLAEKEPLHRAFRAGIEHIRREEAQHHSNPMQWMIPQLYATRLCEHVVDWASEQTPLQFTGMKFLFGESRLTLERQEGYRFIGRRRERRAALRPLLEKKPVLLKGQGGVGKTAMAEYLVQRLMANNPKVYPFVFDEKRPTVQAFLDDILAHFETHHWKKYRSLRREVRGESENPLEQFQFLLEKLEEVCDPVFVFDNLESFQEGPGGKPFADEHEELRELIAFLGRIQAYPLILTGRYPVLEVTELQEVDLNQVAFNDFWQKVQQLRIRDLKNDLQQAAFQSQLQRRPGEKVQPLTFHRVVEMLHRNFGGNYRALELFDRLYREHKGKIPQTLQELEALYRERSAEVVQEMSENLVFGALLGELTGEERHCLQLLARFRIPALPLAIDLQDALAGPAPAPLDRLVELTLAERHLQPLTELTYYYVTPLVKDLLEEAEEEQPQLSFSDLRAGDYYYHVDQHINHYNYADLEEAFWHYYRAEEKDKVNEIGATLCSHFYRRSSFAVAFAYGQRTRQLLGEATNGRVWNDLGLICQLYGKLDEALFCLEQSLKDDHLRGDRQGEGTTLNNLATTAHAKGDYETALRYLEQSLRIQQEIGDRKGEGTTLNNLATTAHTKGDYETALRYLEQSLRIQQEIGDRKGEGTTLNNISQIYDAKGDYETALRYLEQSLRIRQEIGDRSGSIATLHNMAQIAWQKEDPQQYLKYELEAWQLATATGDAMGIYHVGKDLGLVLCHNGMIEQGLPMLEAANQVARQAGFPDADQLAAQIQQFNMP